jgi:3-oxoacyl-[acyl-carrier-protein] synthase III
MGMTENPQEWQIVIEDLLAKARRSKNSVSHYCYIIANGHTVDEVVNALNEKEEGAYKFWARPWEK